MSTLGEIWERVRARKAVVPVQAKIAPDRILDRLSGDKTIVPHKQYFAVVVNELFLHKAREWRREFDPVVLAITEFMYAGKYVSLPFLVGPKLLGTEADKAPQGMLYRNTRVAGVHPYRGGKVTSTMVLCRLQQRDYAKGLLSLVEAVAGAVPFGAELQTYTKLADSLLGGMDALLGMREMEPLVGLREEFDHDLGYPIESAYFVLVDSPEGSVQIDHLWVRNGSLLSGASVENLQPYRDSSYTLYSVRGINNLTELDTLPFAPTADRIVQLAASPDEDDWKLAKAELLVLYRELLITPDLTRDQAQTYHADVVNQAKEAREHAKKISHLDIKMTLTGFASDDHTELQKATEILDLD